MSAPVQLTGQQRVTRMLERRDHDRVPRHDHFWPETIERWQREGLDGDREQVLDRLDGDFHRVGPMIAPRPFPEQQAVVSEDEQTRVVRDGFGKTVRYWKQRSGTPEHLGFDCDTRRKWETIYKPALLDTGLQVDPAAMSRQLRIGRRRQHWCYIAGLEGFEQTRALMGDEITLMAMAEDPEWVRDVSHTVTTELIRNLDAVFAAGAAPDGLWIYGDMAFNHATMCSPAMYRELIWPDHKRLADWAHAHGMKLIFHTDGDVRGVLDLYVEAGFDMLQPLEAKANMDIRELAPAYADRLALFGNIDARIIGGDDVDRLEHELRLKLEAAKASRGYAYHSDHSVPPTVSWPRYQFLIDLIERYGRYDR